MKIGIAGPIATNNIADLLAVNTAVLPHGYYGAPLLATLIESLLARGHEVVAFTTSPDIPPTSEPVVATGERFRIYYCPSRRRAFRRENGHWGRAADSFRLERESLVKAMRITEPDVIHAHWSYEFAMAAIESGLPSLITCHDAPQVVLRHIPDPYRLVRYFMARRVLSRARHLTAVSPYLKDTVQQYARVPIAVVPNPIPSALIQSIAGVRALDPARPRIAMVLNGWGKRKNPKPALAAFALLRQNIPGAELIVMGQDFGPNEPAQRWCESRGISAGIRYCGRLSYPDLLAELTKANLLLHPSLEETFGMAVAEAMAIGVPVVGGATSGAVPWVIGNGGVVTDIRSADAIADAMMRLLSDGATYSRVSQQAHHEANSRFTADQVTLAYETQYHLVVSGERKCG